MAWIAAFYGVSMHGTADGATRLIGIQARGRTALDGTFYDGTAASDTPPPRYNTPPRDLPAGTGPERRTTDLTTRRLGASSAATRPSRARPVVFLVHVNSAPDSPGNIASHTLPQLRSDRSWL